MTFRFGQLYHSSREQFERAFEWYESLYYMFVFWVYTVITAFLMPIIRLYTSGIADASIYDSKKMLLFVCGMVDPVLCGNAADPAAIHRRKI